MSEQGDDVRRSRCWSADEPVVGLHHRVGEEHLPLDGARPRESRGGGVRELAEPVGEVALPVPAQTEPRLRRRRPSLRADARGRAEARAGPARHPLGSSEHVPI